MKYDYHIIVIGAGSGGLVVASGAASLGAKVALIEGNKMGGDCLNTGCIPSKSFLKGAHLASDINSSEQYGIHSKIKSIDLGKLMDRVNSVIEEIAPHDSVERYRSLGVDVYEGYGSFEDSHSVKVNNKIITGKNIVIATGSTSFIPSIKGLNTVPFLTSENIFKLKDLPEHLIVLGAGPIGAELGQGFRHLGSKVTLIDKADKLFSKEDDEVSPILTKKFIADGIQLKLSYNIVEVLNTEKGISVKIEKDGIEEIITGDKLLVSLGRKPVSANLNLQTVGVKTNDRGYVITNKKLETNVKNIYACGDITGPFQFTHMAGYQASIVIQNAIFPIKKTADYQTVSWTTYTKPEIAHVGLTEQMAKSYNIAHSKILVPLSSMDRAKTDNDRDGFLKIIINSKSRIIGATLVGEKAGDQISIANLAILKKLKLSSFLGVIFSYPTESEIFKFAALQSLKDSFKPWQKNLVKKFFL